MIGIGMQVRDVITGFSGRVTGYVQYITGCNQALVQPPAKDDEFKDSHWFDIHRLEQVGDSIISLQNDETPGPDQQAPIK